MKKCSYKNCDNVPHPESTVKFFSFPSIQNRCTEWIIASGNESLHKYTIKTLSTKFYICSEHFLRTDFIKMVHPFRTKLKSDSVPISFTNNRPKSSNHSNGKDIVSNPDTPTSSAVTENPLVCCVVGCSNKHIRRSFFKFPSSGVLISKWRNAIPVLKSLKEPLVCSLHFKKEDMIIQKQDSNSSTDEIRCNQTKTILKPDAVPTIFDENCIIKPRTPDQSAVPKKCCVPNCRSNCDSKSTCRLYPFPKYEMLVDKWLKAVNRKNFTPNKHSVVCAAHFAENAFIRTISTVKKLNGKNVYVQRQTPLLRRNAIPTIFPENERTSVSVHTDASERLPFSFNEILEKFDKINYDNEFWIPRKSEKCISFCHISDFPNAKISVCVSILGDCSVKVYFNQKEIKNKIGSYVMPESIVNLKQLGEVLEVVMKVYYKIKPTDQACNITTVLCIVINLLSSICEQNYQYINNIKFICKQLQLMTMKNVVYSSELTVFSSLFYLCSPNGYRFVKNSGYLILPSYSIVQNINYSLETPAEGEEEVVVNDYEEKKQYFLCFIKERYHSISLQDQTVSLVIDEVCIKPYLDDNMTYGDDVSTVYVFTISSCTSQFKDVVHILSSNNLDAHQLYCFIRKVILGLEKIGYKVICVVTNNKLLNKKAMAMFGRPAKISFVYPHPCGTSRPLFYLLDGLDIIACLRNDWISHKTEDKFIAYPNFDFDFIYVDFLSKSMKAVFTTLVEIMLKRDDEIVECSSKLSLDALLSSTSKCKDADLIHEIFNKHLIKLLYAFGDSSSRQNYKETAVFLQIIDTWLSVLNIQSLNEHRDAVNNSEVRLTISENDANINFLEYFVKWLDAWNELNLSNDNISKQIILALKVTSLGLLELCQYCTSELKIKFILPSKLRTDHFESIFGFHKSLPERTYNTSALDIHAFEKTVRSNIKSHSGLIEDIHIPDNIGSLAKSKIYDYWDFNFYSFQDKLSKRDNEFVLQISSYCCYLIDKKLNCSICKDMLVSYNLKDVLPNYESQDVNESRLLYPNDIVQQMVRGNIFVLKHLLRDDYFSCVSSHKHVVINLTNQYLVQKHITLPFDTCMNGHSSHTLQQMIVWITTRYLFDNY